MDHPATTLAALALLFVPACGAATTSTTPGREAAPVAAETAPPDQPEASPTEPPSPPQPDVDEAPDCVEPSSGGLEACLEYQGCLQQEARREAESVCSQDPESDDCGFLEGQLGSEFFEGQCYDDEE